MSNATTRQEYTSNYENIPTYPGMCRPYAVRNNNNTIVEQTKTLPKSHKIMSGSFNPFSVYDDDSNVNNTHHFLVPAISKDLANFKRTFKELNAERIKLNHSKMNCERSSVKHKKCLSSRTCAFKEHECLISKNDNSGDYCTLSRIDKSKTQCNFKVHTHCKSNIKKENLKDFANLLVTTDDNDCKTKRTRESLVELSYSPKSLRKSKKHYKINRMIDICTCMICVKAISYQCTSDDTDEYVEPCSCTGGSKKSNACRWLCLTPLVFILPCLLCYPPAKLCQKTCTSDNCRTRLKCPVEEDETYEARYIRDPTEKSTFL